MVGEVLCTCSRSHSRAERLASDSAPNWVLGCTMRGEKTLGGGSEIGSEIVGESGTKFMSPAAMRRRVRGERGPEGAWRQLGQRAHGGLGRASEACRAKV